MAQAEKRHDHGGHVLGPLLPRHVVGTMRRSTGFCCEFQRLANGQVREVLVNLLIVYHFAAEFLEHLLLGDTVVVDCGVLVKVQSAELSTDCLQ